MKKPLMFKISLMHVPLSIARECDVPQEDVLAAAGLGQLPNERSNETVPADALLAAIHHVIEAVDDPQRVANALDAFPMEVLGLPGFIMRSCPTLGDAFERFSRYQALLFEGRVATMQMIDDGDALLLEAPPVTADTQKDTEIIAARLMVAVAIGRRLTGVNWSPASASLPTHNALGRVCELYLRCPIEQREGPARLVLDANTLALPIAENQPDMLDWFEEEARRRMPLEEPTPERSTTARVRERLRALGPWQSTDAHDIARDVGMSRRTLFRKLRSEGSSLQGLRDELRQEAAEELLRETSHDHGTIGTMLGFSDGRAFARAFRRWTGSSPTDWRAGHATGEGH